MTRKLKNQSGFGLHVSCLFHGEGCQLVAASGTARLVKKPDGRHELIGGTMNDHANTRERCSLFAGEVVFCAMPWRNPDIAFAV
jgi:hypothetical protein